MQKSEAMNSFKHMSSQLEYWLWLFSPAEQFHISVFKNLEQNGKKKNQANKENSKKQKRRSGFYILLPRALKMLESHAQTLAVIPEEQIQAAGNLWAGPQTPENAYRVMVSLPILRSRFVLSED